jgi:hypothetical protein
MYVAAEILSVISGPYQEKYKYHLLGKNVYSCCCRRHTSNIVAALSKIDVYSTRERSRITAIDLESNCIILAQMEIKKLHLYWRAINTHDCCIRGNKFLFRSELKCMTCFVTTSGSRTPRNSYHR